ncbi:peptidase S10 [Methylocystis parvus]|uniref:Peptidase S10 n=2 Tax=Methylocystis parvus TaxID=134 RepID=A0A6B8M3P7_9HYPH|nr:peptidase S10 [Methylocystis parvus]
MSLCAPVLAEAPPPNAKAAEQQSQTRGLPPEAVTSHAIALQGEKIAFTARAGAIRLKDAKTEAPQADVAYVSYERSGIEASGRPVVFIFNGGPGAASAWLGLGAISPWRLRFPPETPSPSLTPVLLDNAETWLAFGDLVFIDPPGTGYSKFLSEKDDVEKRFFSVDGDAEALAVVIRKWLTARGRLTSPKYIVGESYGGFRAVKLLAPLRERENIGVDGLFLVSPALDFTWLQGGRPPLSYAALLPSLAAVARNARDRGQLADVEAYAAADYVVDLLKGPKDPQAQSRMSEAVARFTALDRNFVARLGARVDAKSFSRERKRNEQRIVSAYDGGVEGYDPDPFAPGGDWADPVLDAWRAPLGAAMTLLTQEKLAWPIGDARYAILDGRIARHWDFGHGGRANAEALSDMRDALALDPRLKIVVLQGVADLVIPYFATRLILDQLPAYGDADRVRLVVTAGGHMPYLRDEGRARMRDEARKLIERH